MVTLALIAALLTAFFPSPDADARTILFKRLKVNCHQITIAFKSNNPGGAAFGTVRLFIDGLQVDSQTGDPTGFVAQFPFDGLAGQYAISGEITVGSEIITGSTTVTCKDKSKGIKPDKRICFAPGQAPAAVYLRGGLEVWAIDANDQGVQAIDVREKDIKRLPDFPPHIVFIARSDLLVQVEFMKNPDGGFQVNVGPDAEGKVFECFFSFGAPENAVVRTWLTP